MVELLTIEVVEQYLWSETPLLARIMLPKGTPGRLSGPEELGRPGEVMVTLPRRSLFRVLTIRPWKTVEEYGSCVMNGAT